MYDSTIPSRRSARMVKPWAESNPFVECVQRSVPYLLVGARSPKVSGSALSLHFTLPGVAFIALIDDLLYYFPRHLFSLSLASNDSVIRNCTNGGQIDCIRSPSSSSLLAAASLDLGSFDGTRKENITRS